MYGHYNHGSINGDIVILSLGESNINNNNFYDISPNFITKAIDLLYYYSLLSFKDILI